MITDHVIGPVTFGSGPDPCEGNKAMHCVTSSGRPVPVALRVLERFLDILARTCRVITGFSLVFLTAIFGWLVFGRYVLNATPTWVEQAALILVMTIAFLGAAVGVHENGHLSVMMLRDALPRRWNAALALASDIILGAFGVLMAVFGARLTLFKWDTMIPLLNLPEGLRSLPLTISGGLIFLFCLGHVVRRLACPGRTDPLHNQQGI
ncbi:TRAP-type C4-dicarboxylate transport system permease small subunit [Albidovulum inexpectatum]|uniref:TRAP transporter small permease protein n=1 Tax=Albidovulum inexpectatum TaxID=196587 RepID=A0A2S5JH20_9RHOB|nr:TRAP transporter small permease [Albidovulum inexpectatum]PPB80816.1 TRAP-type C4-dicarboxylate transport system permease small subunit [Albidovulum inexpectatum]